MKKSRFLALFGFAAATLLSACVSSNSPNLERYTLTQDVSQSAFISNRPVFVALSSILAQGGVVVEISDVALRPAKHYRYSANLDSEMRYLAIDTLDKAKFPEKYTVKIFVSKFQGSLEGEAKVALYLEVSEKEKVLYSKSFSRVSKLADDGYSSLVRQLKYDYISILNEFLSDFKKIKKF